MPWSPTPPNLIHGRWWTTPPTPIVRAWVVGIASRITATAQRATAALTGNQPLIGTAAATLAPATAALVGNQPFHGNVTAELQQPTANLSGVMQPEGQAAVVLRNVLFAGSVTNEGTLAASAQPTHSALAGFQQQQGDITAALKAATTALSGTQTQQGAIAATARPATASLAASHTQQGILAASARAATAAMSGSQFNGVVFDATGAGGTGFVNGATTLQFSWTHTASGSGRAVVVGVALNRLSNNITGLTVTYGGNAMTLLGERGFANGALTQNRTAMFGLLNPPTGAQTVQVTATFNASWFASASACSTSYNNVSRFSAASLNHGTGTSRSQSVSAAVNEMVAQVFGQGNTTAMSSYNQTQRDTESAQATGLGPTRVLLGDAPGAATVNFTATGPNAAWSSVAVRLQP